MSKFRYWLGSPQGALFYFGVAYTLMALLLLWWWFH